MCHLQAGVVEARNDFIILLSLVSVTMNLGLGCVTDGHTSQIMVMTLELLEMKVQLLDELLACNWIPHTAQSACLYVIRYRILPCWKAALRCLHFAEVVPNRVTVRAKQSLHLCASAMNTHHCALLMRHTTRTYWILKLNIKRNGGLQAPFAWPLGKRAAVDFRAGPAEVAWWNIFALPRQLNSGPSAGS